MSGPEYQLGMQHQLQLTAAQNLEDVHPHLDIECGTWRMYGFEHIVTHMHGSAFVLTVYLFISPAFDLVDNQIRLNSANGFLAENSYFDLFWPKTVPHGVLRVSQKIASPKSVKLDFFENGNQNSDAQSWIHTPRCL